MKISDFLRMKITPDNKQFDTIKNIRFYDDKTNLLVGKGTTTVHSFCESFFDYVYRNYSSARGAEKLVKQNRKKYTRYSGSESMLLVQRILNEICNEYAISNYSITCEVDSPAAKKPAAQPAAHTAAPVNVTPQHVTPQTVTPASVTPAVVKSVEPATVKSVTPVAAPVGKLKVLASELERLQPSGAPKENKPEQKPVEKEQGKQEDFSRLDETYIHPEIRPDAQLEQGTTPEQGTPPVQGTTPVQGQTAEVQQAAEAQVQQAVQVAEELKAAISGETVQGTAPAQVTVPVQETTPVQGTTPVQDTAPAQGTAPAQSASSVQNVQNQQNNQNVKNQQGKNGKKGKNKDFKDARMKPGKGYKPFKPNENFKETSKFQVADTRSSQLDIDAIPCIAVVEEEKIPTIEEVPFIGIPEDNSIPSMDAVPYLGTEETEAGKAIPDVPYLGAEDGEKGKAIPDVPYLGAEDGEKGKAIPNVPYLGLEDGIAVEYESHSNLAEQLKNVPAEKQVPEKKHDIMDAIIEAEFPEEEANIEEPEAEISEQPEEVQQPAQAQAVAAQPTEVQQPAQAQAVAAQPTAVQQPAQAQAVAAQPTAVQQPVQVQPVAAQPAAAQQPTQPVAVQKPAPQAGLTLAQVQQGTVQKSQQTASTAVKTAETVADANDIRSIVATAILKYKQVIFTGPSGTGKTYQARKFARKYTKGYDGCKFVQFHPSFEYSDFIEGLRPVNIINTTNATNVRLDGVFKGFCRAIVEDNLEQAVPGFSTLYSEKKQKVVQELFEAIRDKREALEEGTESEYFAPDSKEYIFDNGVREYYFIIDEINRADAARVFGDVLFALDEDYRGIENRFDTRLGNLKNYRVIQADDIGKANYQTSHIGFAEQMKFDCFERGFFIPRNLHIIATMNELGGSETDMDFSVKQKFRWVSIKPADIMKTSLKEMLKDRNIYWLDQFTENLNLVNRLISEGLSNEFCLGPAFFRKLTISTDSIDEVFTADVEPLLKEYLKGKPEDIAGRFVTECRKALKIGI